jgi:hypothetical protein
MDFISQIPLIVSYYTKETPYEKEVEHLIGSCKRFGLEYHIEGIEDRGSWEENCAYKPYFMREKMKAFQRPLLWVDADAVFLKPLEFEDFMFSDFVFSYEPRIQDPRFSAFAGTVYVNFTEGGISGLDLWCRYSDEIIKAAGKAVPFSDQSSLHFAILSKPEFNIGNLPLTHAKIFDRVIHGLDPTEIVIEHNQASRRFRNRETPHVH